MEDLVDSRRVEGIMVINPYADRRYMHLPLDFPTVFAGARPREGEINSIALDDEMVGYEATRHLLDLLHRDIAMITGPMSEDATQDRCQGYERALREVGIESEPHWVIEGDWSARSGHDALMQLATADSLPGAIFAQNDLMAAGVMRATKDLGLEVPHDLSVIGVDDIPLSAFFDPPLATFHQDFQQIGRKAASLLIQSIDQPDAHSRQLRLPADLIVRRSTADFKPKS
jgi:DNA-binding LacI/PurR family transcriptional regulator